MIQRLTIALLLWVLPFPALAWHDETHIAIAIAAGYRKWFNAAGADITKIKAGDVEQKNHFANNPQGTVVTPEMVLDQVNRYNNPADEMGHLYGAILGAIREYKSTNLQGKYAEYHIAFCAHYVGDLSQPLHNTLYTDYNQQNHAATDGVINDEVLDNLSRIKVHPVQIRSEADLGREIARIANTAMKLGYQLEQEGRLMTKEEAYRQVSQSASLLEGILHWLGK